MDEQQIPFDRQLIVKLGLLLKKTVPKLNIPIRSNTELLTRSRQSLHLSIGLGSYQECKQFSIDYRSYCRWDHLT